MCFPYKAYPRTLFTVLEPFEEMTAQTLFAANTRHSASYVNPTEQTFMCQT